MKASAKNVYHFLPLFSHGFKNWISLFISLSSITRVPSHLCTPLSSSSLSHYYSFFLFFSSLSLLPVVLGSLVERWSISRTLNYNDFNTCFLICLIVWFRSLCYFHVYCITPAHLFIYLFTYFFYSFIWSCRRFFAT